MKFVSALSMAETLGSGEFPHPSNIIKITFLFIVKSIQIYLIFNKSLSLFSIAL